MYIRQYGGVAASFDVFTDFRPFYSSFANARKVYKPTGNATLEERHAVVLVGYNNDEGYWLILNSWGPDWADNGLFRVRAWRGVWAWRLHQPATEVCLLGVQLFACRNIVAACRKQCSHCVRLLRVPSLLQFCHTCARVQCRNLCDAPAAGMLAVFTHSPTHTVCRLACCLFWHVPTCRPPMGAVAFWTKGLLSCGHPRMVWACLWRWPLPPRRAASITRCDRT
jgi:hypothetical protein